MTKKTITTEEASNLIAEFMGYNPLFAERYHLFWDALMPVITKLKSIDPDWINEEAQHLIDDIDDALTCCWGIKWVCHFTVDAIMNYNEYKS